MGALEDALNGLTGNEAALKELATLKGSTTSLGNEVEALKADKLELTNAAGASTTKESELAEDLAQKNARIAELGGQVTEAQSTKEQLTAMTTERDTAKKSLGELEAANVVDIKVRLETFGLSADAMKDKDLVTLKAMEVGATSSRGGTGTGSQLPGSGQGLSGGAGGGKGGAGSDADLTPLQAAEVQMAGLRANPNGTKAEEKVIS